MNTIHLGDNAAVLPTLPARFARLVYIDPPFGSQANYVHEARLDGAADGRVSRAHAYSDRWRASDADDGMGDYLDMLAPRLEAAARLMAPTGTLWVHLDWRANYLVRVVLDEILGRDRFINEIIWRRAPNLGRQAASGQFGRTLDSLIVYGGATPKLVMPTRLERIEKSAIRWDDEKRPFTCAPRGDYTDASIEKLDLEGRVHRTATGKVYIKYFLTKDDEGHWCRERRIDTLWTDVAPLRHASALERTGFPTQKPLALLDRIVRCATPQRGLVVDLFAGSGTTGVAAHECGRRFILGDAGSVAIANARARLLAVGAGLSIETVGDAGRVPEGAPVVAAVARVGRRELEVKLGSPVEPFAWTVGTWKGRGTAFSAAWHSERRHGKKAIAAERTARIDARVLDGPERLAVRVYGDDGSVATGDVSLRGAS